MHPHFWGLIAYPLGWANFSANATWPKGTARQMLEVGEAEEGEGREGGRVSAPNGGAPCPRRQGGPEGCLGLAEPQPPAWPQVSAQKGPQAALYLPLSGPPQAPQWPLPSTAAPELGSEFPEAPGTPPPNRSGERRRPLRGD